MLFAEVGLNDLIVALITAGVLVIGSLAAVIVTALKFVQRRIEKRIDETDTTKVTQAVAQKVHRVYEQINGDGLTGSVRRIEKSVERIEENQKVHEEKDAQQFKDMRKYMGMPESQ